MEGPDRNPQDLGKFRQGETRGFPDPGGSRPRHGNLFSFSALDFPDTFQNFLPDVAVLFPLFEFLVRIGPFQTPPSVASRCGEKFSKKEKGREEEESRKPSRRAQPESHDGLSNLSAVNRWRRKTRREIHPVFSLNAKSA